jgi:hypothetical protein
VLAAIGTSAAFATRFTVEADPQLHVDGVGTVQLPVSIQAAHRLCAVAQPTPHGYKDQTRLDPRVRDTWEIAANRLRFDSPQWSATLDRALDRVAHDLGLPPGTPLKAQLHNLLIYAPGQFFATHQDSEKADGMLGTLIVTLPSRFSGGEFVVSHQGQTLRARGSLTQLGMIAFYADCLHEVRAVKEGYRVVLTYNLIARDSTPVAAVSTQEIATLSAAVHAFWNTPAAPRWRSDTDIAPPNRLVYLLDHQYTPSGLAWHRLKGADATRAAALRNVAEQLDAEIFLTLADVHEIWNAEDNYQESYPTGKRHASNHTWNDDDDDDEEDDTTDDSSNLELIDLIESEIELRHWIAVDGSKLQSEQSRVDDAELCVTRDSSDCTPFQSTYEGYTGNYGNTLDRWYHRAALVLWPRERAFVIRARLSPLWAIKQIGTRLKTNGTVEAHQWAASLQPFWQSVVARAGDATLLNATLSVAVMLDDARLAAALLAPFSLAQLTPKMAPHLLHLLERHGLAWCEERLRQWTPPHWQNHEAQLTWLAQTLPSLVQAWSRAGAGGVDLATTMVQERWAWLWQYITQTQANQYSKGSEKVTALTATSAALLALIYASHEAKRPPLRQPIIDALLSKQLPIQVPLGVLHAINTDLPDLASLGLAPVHAHCLQTLSAHLAQPKRAADDWSITAPADRASLQELNEPLTRFLSSTQRQLEWPLAEPKRQLIRQFIDRHELPLKHETRRSGRPYTLVLEKTLALFKRETAERQLWTRELAWLTQAGQASEF